MEHVTEGVKGGEGELRPAVADLNRILEDACSLGVRRAVLLGNEGAVLAQGGEATGDEADRCAAASDAVKLRVPVTVRGSQVASLQVIGAEEEPTRLERTAHMISARLADAWTVSEEIDSLASEIVHSYEELHLLYELGEALVSELALSTAADLILERISNTLDLAWAELRLAGDPARVFVRRGQATPSDGAPDTGDEYLLSTELRSGGRNVGSIVLVRSRKSQPFSSADAKLLDAAGSIAAHAICNAQLYEELRRQAETLRASESRLRTVVNNIGEGIITLDEDSIVESTNPAAELIFGYSSGELAGQHFSQLIPDAYSRGHYADLGRYLTMGHSSVTGSKVREATGRRKNGATFLADVSVSEISIGEQRLYILSVRDITERKQWEEALQHQALYDALTNLPNRMLLYDRLQRDILATRRTESPLALLVMDLDRFKEVNDTFGHQYGDLLLRQIGPRLQDILRQSDTVARLGGDEFAVVLPGADGSDATSVALKLLKALEDPFVVDGHQLELGGSIGIALCPEHAKDADTLLRQADIAMYVAKRAHSGYAVYASGEDNHSANRLALISELRSAIERGQLILHYQPKLDLKTRRVVHVEALVRWLHPHRGLIMPGEFIPLAEMTGLIRPLSRWVIDAALAQCHAWRSMGMEIGVAVNMSAQYLHDLQLPNVIADLLHLWKVPAELLTIEITENSLADEPRISEVLQGICAQGVRVSIDDFGIGYSSLGYLKQLPVDEIKIDKFFVQHMAVRGNDAAIVRSTISLCHDLGLAVVAEGVEDQATLDLLCGLGCDLIQGNHFSHPVPPAQLERWLKTSFLAARSPRLGTASGSSMG